MYVKQELGDHVRLIEAREQVVWIEVKAVSSNQTIGFVYNQPQDSPYTDAEMFEHLQDDVLRFVSRSSNIMVFGDFNARIGNLDDRALIGSRSDLLQIPDFLVDEVEIQARSSRDGEVNQYGKKLIQFCVETGFRVLNGRTPGDVSGKECAACGMKITNVFVHRIMACPRTTMLRRTASRTLWFSAMYRAPESRRFSMLQKHIQKTQNLKEIAAFF